MGSPINTPGDDLFYVVTADGNTAYYSSVREGGMGGKDIYKISFTYPDNKKVENQSNLTLFKGVVIDYDSFLPLEADMEIIDNDSNEVITSIKSNSVTGKFLISLPAGKNYGIAVKKDGYLFYSENFNIPDSAAFKKIDKHIPLQKLTIGHKITLKNIFYDYGKASLRAESKTELTRLVNLMKPNPFLKIEVASYTDSEGSEQYNLTLSQARTQAVVDYLLSQGISSQQLIAKGYGEADPLFSNDTEEGREINRRTEFKILNNE
jgi:outer membrane protein OmpA-like peptidoglycan-associated protein